MDRRGFLKFTSAAGVFSQLTTSNSAIAQTCDNDRTLHPHHWKKVPQTGERIPSVGMGTWITFDVGDVASQRNQRSRVLQHFFDLGGGMVDSSPMYGHAESVLGYCLKRTTGNCQLISASKIWTPIALEGRAQMRNTETLWNLDQIDLMYVHNLVNWEKHLPQLREWKSEQRIRYLGLTTSHGRRHEELEKLLKSEVIDFVQLTYNYDRRETENRLIPLASDHGVVVVANRPFARGHLVDKYQPKPLPPLAKELGCDTWAQYLLLFVVSHPDITVAIPATSREDHMNENMAVMQLELPDQKTRQLM